MVLTLMKLEIEVRATTEEVVEAAAKLFVQVAQESVRERGRFLVALSGGSTPRALHQRLASQEYRKQIDWENTEIFFGDERAVASGDERSNAHMARESLLDVVPIPAENIHLMRGDATDLNDAAREYGLLLQEVGSLDLILLGMGDDGHTASLFPRSPQLKEAKHRCVATPISPTEPFLPRLTMTFPFLNSARNVLILVTGKSKAERVAQVLPLVKSSTRNTEELPITNVQPEGTLMWMLDEAALGNLKTESLTR